MGLASTGCAGGWPGPEVRALLRAAMPLPELTPERARQLVVKHLVNRTRSRKSRIKAKGRSP